MSSKVLPTPSTCLALAAAIVAAAACGTSVPPAQDAGSSGPDATTVTGLGADCATGCIGSLICANASDECERGYCLFDGRGDALGSSYCTADCSAVACPAGYHCEDVPFELARACVADPAVCGDGVVERGEACDDGNTVSGDGCRGDCVATDTPAGDQRRVRATFTVSGHYVPVGGVDTAFTATAAVDAELNGSDACPSVRDTAAGSGPIPWRRFLVSGCDGATQVYQSFSVPYAVGTYPAGAAGFPALCASLDLPPPDNARLDYCAAPGMNSLVVTAVTGTAANGNGPSGASGTFEGQMAYVPNQAIGGCESFRPPSACPAVPPSVVDVSGTFKLTNIE